MFAGSLVVAGDHVVVLFEVLSAQQLSRDVRVLPPDGLAWTVAMFPTELVDCAVDGGDCEVYLGLRDSGRLPPYPRSPCTGDCVFRLLLVANGLALRLI